MEPSLKCIARSATAAILILIVGACNDQGMERLQANAGDVVCVMKENTLENAGLAIGLTTDIAVAANVISDAQVAEGKAAIGQAMDAAREPIEAAKEAARSGCRTAVTNSVGAVRDAVANAR